MDCDNKIDEYTEGCNNGYSGIVYFNGDDQWIISITSEQDDYYKVFATESTMRFVPLSASWTEIETSSGISQSSYTFTLRCDEAMTISPTTYQDEQQQQVVTEYVYVETWFWITMVLLVLFLVIICALIWMCRRKRKANSEQNRNARGNEMPRIVMPSHAAVPSKSQFTPRPGIAEPNALQPVFSASADVDISPPLPAAVPPSPLSPPDEADGDNQTTTGFEWNDDDENIFTV